MRAAQMVNIRQPLEVVTLPDPTPAPHGAVVRVEASGVCRSDWHFWNGDWGWAGLHLPLPAVLGHEVGGTVVAVGRAVEGVRVGDRVTVPFHEADGTCPECRAGRPNLCDHLVNPGIDRAGGWAEYVAVTHADLNCLSLPDGVEPLSAAALGCRFMTAYRAVTARGKVRPGQWVSVHGCGGVGLSAVQIAAASDARVVAVDVDERKLDRAREEGALATVSARGCTPEQVAQAIQDQTDGGVHVSIDALGRAFTVQQSVLALRKGGRHVQVGLTSQEEQGEVALPIDLLVNREWEFVGSLGNPHPDYAELLALVAGGKLNPSRLVSRQLDLVDISGVLEDMTRFDTLGFEVVTRFSSAPGVA